MSYEEAYKTAIKTFQSLDLTEILFNSSASLLEENIIIYFLGEAFMISENGKTIIRIDSKSEAKIAEKIILLHYLITADGTPLTRDLITLEGIQGASFYFPTYKARTIDVLVRHFRNDVKLFADKCKSLGVNTEPALVGNAKGLEAESVKATFLVLPNIPVYIIYRTGDKEFSPGVKILYDANIEHYLPLEDIIVMTELLTHKIIRTDSFKKDNSASSALI